MPQHEENVVLKFSNSELENFLLEEKYITETRLKRMAAEEELHRKLATKNLSTLKTKKQTESQSLTQNELLILAINDALEFFGKYNDPYHQYRDNPNTAWFRMYPTVPRYYTETFETLSKLLDQPDSLEHAQTLLDIASKIEGHIKWCNIIGGIALIASGIALAATFWILPLALGTLTTSMLIVPLMMTVVAVGISAAGGITFCSGRAYAHAAELHKVIDAAQPPQGCFGSLFGPSSKESKETVEIVEHRANYSCASTTSIAPRLALNTLLFRARANSSKQIISYMLCFHGCHASASWQSS